MNDVGTFMIYLQPSTHGNSENIKHPTLACHLKKHLEGEKGEAEHREMYC